VERSVIEEILKIIKSPEVIINLNRLSEQRKDIRKDDLMTALKNLNEAWSYLYQAEQTKIVKILVECVEIKENGIKRRVDSRFSPNQTAFSCCGEFFGRADVSTNQRLVN
jgi:hypothetical protein